MADAKAIDEALSDQAIEWVVRLHSGNATQTEHDAFAKWRHCDPQHEAAAREAEAIWNGIGTAGYKVRKNERANARAKISRRALLGVASAGLIGGGLVQTGLLRLTFLADYSTGIGEQKTIVLSDGSTIQMNARSALSVSFDRIQRLISLFEGQATFSVAHDPARPFLVAAANGQTKTIGTVFDVDMRPEDVAVTVLDGTVSVTTKMVVDHPVSASLNQRVRYTDDGMILPAEEVDADIETAWRRGKLVFNNRRLAEVVAEVERYRRGKIVLVGSSLQQLSVTGLFDLTDPESVLTTIRQTLPVRITELPLVTIIRHA